MPDEVLEGGEMSALRERIVACICATVGPMLRASASEELYALAITTDSDVATLRLAAHTEEALKTLLEGTGDLAEDDADYYRWWPDEWEALDDDVTPESGVETTADICGAMFEASRSFAAHDAWRAQSRAALEGALGDPRVHSSVAKVNPAWRPVLFVTDTDGDMRKTVRSIDALNKSHPNPPLVASARTYFAQND